MTNLASLLSDLERALSAEDLDLVASVRRTICDGHPSSPAAAEASYKLGLDALYRRQDLDGAAEYLREAVRKKDNQWSPAARVSLALVLLSQKKYQQALFELRKAASVQPPTLLSAQAAGLTAVALADAKKPGAEVERAREKAKAILLQLASASDAVTASVAAFMLGVEFKFEGEREKARTWLERALAADQLPAQERRLAEGALQTL